MSSRQSSADAGRRADARRSHTQEGRPRSWHQAASQAASRRSRTTERLRTVRRTVAGGTVAGGTVAGKGPAPPATPPAPPQALPCSEAGPPGCDGLVDGGRAPLPPCRVALRPESREPRPLQSRRKPSARAAASHAALRHDPWRRGPRGGRIWRLVPPGRRRTAAPSKGSRRWSIGRHVGQPAPRRVARAAAPRTALRRRLRLRRPGGLGAGALRPSERPPRPVDGLPIGAGVQLFATRSLRSSTCARGERRRTVGEGRRRAVKAPTSEEERRRRSLGSARARPARRRPCIFRSSGLRTLAGLDARRPGEGAGCDPRIASRKISTLGLRSPFFVQTRHIIRQVLS